MLSTVSNVSPASACKISSDLVISSRNLLTKPENLVQSCRSNAAVDSRKTKSQVIADFHVKSTGRSEVVLANAENSKASSNVGGQSAALTATCSSDHLDAEHSKYDTGDKITRQTRPSKSRKLETINSVAISEDQMCNTSFNVKGDLVRHTKTHGTKRSFQCNACGYECVSASHLENHTRTHTGKRPFECDECDRTFTKKSKLTEHKRSHTGERPFKCDLCDREFSQKGNLTVHERTHTGTAERSFQCDVCEKKFTKKSILIDHKRIHDNERHFKCKECGKAFAQKRNLKVHKRIHTGERPFKCDLCEKTFNQKSNLVTHKKIHTNERHFQCDICEKKFTYKGNLIEHKRIHTNEHPFQCEECEKAFTQKHSLMEHQRGHTGERPFKCDVCGTRFIRSDHLNKHATMHTGTGERLFKCDVCGIGFTRLNYLKKHATLHAGESPFQCDANFTATTSNKHTKSKTHTTNSETEFTTPSDVSTITQLPSVSNQPSTSDIHINKSQHQEEDGEYGEHTETTTLLNEFVDAYPITPDPESCEQHDDFFDSLLLDQEMLEATFPDKQNVDTGYLITQFHPLADWPLTSGIHVNKSQHQEEHEEIAEVLDYDHLQTIPPPKPSWDSD